MALKTQQPIMVGNHLILYLFLMLSVLSIVHVYGDDARDVSRSNQERRRVIETEAKNPFQEPTRRAYQEFEEKNSGTKIGTSRGITRFDLRSKVRSRNKYNRRNQITEPKRNHKRNDQLKKTIRYNKITKRFPQLHSLPSISSSSQLKTPNKTVPVVVAKEVDNRLKTNSFHSRWNRRTPGHNTWVPSPSFTQSQYNSEKITNIPEINQEEQSKLKGLKTSKSKRIAILHIPSTDKQTGVALSRESSNGYAPSDTLAGFETETPFLYIPHSKEKIPLSNLSNPLVSDLLSIDRQDRSAPPIMIKPITNFFKYMSGGNSGGSNRSKHHKRKAQFVPFNQNVGDLPTGQFLVDFGPPKGEDVVNVTNAVSALQTAFENTDQSLFVNTQSGGLPLQQTGVRPAAGQTISKGINAFQESFPPHNTNLLSQQTNTQNGKNSKRSVWPRIASSNYLDNTRSQSSNKIYFPTGNSGKSILQSPSNIPAYIEDVRESSFKVINTQPKWPKPQHPSSISNTKNNIFGKGVQSQGGQNKKPTTNRPLFNLPSFNLFDPFRSWFSPTTTTTQQPRYHSSHIRDNSIHRTQKQDSQHSLSRFDIFNWFSRPTRERNGGHRNEKVHDNGASSPFSVALSALGSPFGLSAQLRNTKVEKEHTPISIPNTPPKPNVNDLYYRTFEQDETKKLHHYNPVDSGHSQHFEPSHNDFSYEQESVLDPYIYTRVAKETSHKLAPNSPLRVTQSSSYSLIPQGSHTHRKDQYIAYQNQPARSPARMQKRMDDVQKAARRIDVANDEERIDEMETAESVQHTSYLPSKFSVMGFLNNFASQSTLKENDNDSAPNSPFKLLQEDRKPSKYPTMTSSAKLFKRYGNLNVVSSKSKPNMIKSKSMPSVKPVGNEIINSNKSNEISLKQLQTKIKQLVSVSNPILKVEQIAGSDPSNKSMSQRIEENVVVIKAIPLHHPTSEFHHESFFRNEKVEKNPNNNTGLTTRNILHPLQTKTTTTPTTKEPRITTEKQPILLTSSQTTYPNINKKSISNVNKNNHSKSHSKSKTRSQVFIPGFHDRKSSDRKPSNYRDPSSFTTSTTVRTRPPFSNMFYIQRASKIPRYDKVKLSQSAEVFDKKERDTERTIKIKLRDSKLPLTKENSTSQIVTTELDGVKNNTSIVTEKTLQINNKSEFKKPKRYINTVTSFKVKNEKRISAKVKNADKEKSKIETKNNLSDIDHASQNKQANKTKSTRKPRGNKFLDLLNARRRGRKGPNRRRKRLRDLETSGSEPRKEKITLDKAVLNPQTKIDTFKVWLNRAKSKPVVIKNKPNAIRISATSVKSSVGKQNLTTPKTSTEMRISTTLLPKIRLPKYSKRTYPQLHQVTTKSASPIQPTTDTEKMRSHKNPDTLGNMQPSNRNEDTSKHPYKTMPLYHVAKWDPIRIRE